MRSILVVKLSLETFTGQCTVTLGVKFDAEESLQIAKIVNVPKPSFHFQKMRPQWELKFLSIRFAKHVDVTHSRTDGGKEVASVMPIKILKGRIWWPSRCVWTPIYICMYICFYLQWLHCWLCDQDHSCLQNGRPVFKIVLYWPVYGHVMTICPSLEKLPLVNVFIYIH